MKNKRNTHYYFIQGGNLIGNDFEVTINGKHFTDLGLQRFSKKKIEVLNVILYSEIF